MPSNTELTTEQLRRVCDPQGLKFQSTDELEPLEEILGQDRAVEAIRFGVSIQGDGYNVFAIGRPGVGKNTLVRDLLGRVAPEEATPKDWCYVNNFERPHQPRHLSLAAGQGRHLQQAMEQLIDDATRALVNAFESQQYQQQRQQVENEAQQQQQEALKHLRDQAEQEGMALLQTPNGFAIVPKKDDGSPMKPDEIEQLPEQQRRAFEEKSEKLQQGVREMLQHQPRAQREARQKLQELNRQIALQAIEPLVQDLQQRFQNNQAVSDHLEAVKADMVENSQKLIQLHEMEQGAGSSDGPQEQQAAMLQQATQGQSPMQRQQAHRDGLRRRYRVNPVVENEPNSGAPVVYENHPNYQNVVGRIEHEAQMGTLVTDFNLIKAGALHRANGGYLVLDAERLLGQPMVWAALKRALQSREIRIESPGEALGLVSTEQLEPEPVPLDVTVVLLGERFIYELLSQYDPDFAELFKIPADFDDRTDRSEQAQHEYARWIASMVQKKNLKPFDSGAVARVLDESARKAGDTQKLSVHMRVAADLLQEADHFASEANKQRVEAEHVQRALDAQVRRADRVRERMHEEIERGTLAIDTQGAQSGQINALAVVPFAEQVFGRPHRVTARVALGKGDVVDIEREVELADPTHAKGVLILSGFLRGRYAQGEPLSLWASLVFEQSYGPVAGDSASLAELCALISAIAEVPIRQSVAITGSVNQRGQAQAIGGVNEKIEGFYDVCKRRGLSGDQGVIIPRANLEHLMLRSDVVEAVGRGEFHVWSVEDVDEALALLTGLEAGEPDERGRYPEKSINGRVQQRLAELTESRRRFMSESSSGNGGAGNAMGPDDGD